MPSAEKDAALTMTSEQWLGALADAWDMGWARGAWDVEENGWESHDLSKGKHPANPYRVNPPGSTDKSQSAEPKA